MRKTVTAMRYIFQAAQWLQPLTMLRIATPLNTAVIPGRRKLLEETNEQVVSLNMRHFKNN